MAKSKSSRTKNRREAAIYFHIDGYDPSHIELNGRRVAGESFLRGYLQHTGGEVAVAKVDSKSQFELFTKFARENGFPGETKGNLIDNPGLVMDRDVLQMPGPCLGDAAWQRHHLGGAGYSICGVTHTTATLRIMQGMMEMRSAPVYEWDGVITTSKAVQASMERLLDEADAFLAERFGKKNLPPRFQMPVIPLGIHVDDFKHDPAQRKSWRERLNLSPDAILVMTMSRLNSFGKFDPLPMFIALENAAQQTGADVHFIAVGPYADKPSTRVFENGARALCPSVTYHHVDGTKEPMANGLWSAADIFTHPVDNIQETFGLAPVEAMAAGLPVVVSDWDGFKDTITPDAGFRIPTHGPMLGDMRHPSLRHFSKNDSYAQYMSLAAFQTVIDVPKMAEAFAALIRDESLRKKMGAAGVKRAASVYDWVNVIPLYQEFWGDLSARRLAAQGQKFSAKPGNIPHALDAADLFASYPTAAAEFTKRRFVAVAKQEARTLVEGMIKLREIAVLKRMTCPADHLIEVLSAVQKSDRIAYEDLKNGLEDAPAKSLNKAISWLLKYNLIAMDAA